MLIGQYASKIPETLNHDILQLAETALKKDVISVLKRFIFIESNNDIADVLSGNRLKAKINKHNLTGFFFISINNYASK